MTAPSPADKLADSSTPTGADAFSPDLREKLGALGALGGIDVAQILTPNPERPATSGDDRRNDAIGEHLEELADDMLAMLRRMREVEEGQKSLATRLDQLQDGWAQSSRTIAREVDSLRRDVLGDRKHSALTDVFGELMPLIDRLRTMRANLHAQDDARMIAQLDGVLETLASCLRRLGCEEFHAAVGTPFDAERMQCTSYLLEGAPGVVLEQTQPGYQCGQLVLRRASIRMAAPTTAKAKTPGDDFDE